MRPFRQEGSRQQASWGSGWVHQCSRQHCPGKEHGERGRRRLGPAVLHLPADQPWLLPNPAPQPPLCPVVTAGRQLLVRQWIHQWGRFLLFVAGAGVGEGQRGAVARKATQSGRPVTAAFRRNLLATTVRAACPMRCYHLRDMTAGFYYVPVKGWHNMRAAEECRCAGGGQPCIRAGPAWLCLAGATWCRPRARLAPHVRRPVVALALSCPPARPRLTLSPSARRNSCLCASLPPGQSSCSTTPPMWMPPP